MLDVGQQDRIGTAEAEALFLLGDVAVHQFCRPSFFEPGQPVEEMPVIADLAGAQQKHPRVRGRGPHGLDNEMQALAPVPHPIVQVDDPVRRDAQPLAGGFGRKGEIPGPGVGQEMEPAGGIVLPESGEKVLVHEVQVPEPSLAAEARKAAGFDHVSGGTARVCQEPGAEIDAAELPAQGSGGHHADRGAAEHAGGDLIEFVQKNLTRLTDFPAFLQRSDFSAPPPAAVLMEKGKDRDLRQQRGELLFDERPGPCAEIDRPGQFKAHFEKVLGHIPKPCQAVADPARLEDQDMSVRWRGFHENGFTLRGRGRPPAGRVRPAWHT